MEVRGQIPLLVDSIEDDLVDVQFDDCPQCEHNFRQMVFILKRSDVPHTSGKPIYSIVVLLAWFCVGALVAMRRWRKVKLKAYRAYELLRC